MSTRGWLLVIGVPVLLIGGLLWLALAGRRGRARARIEEAVRAQKRVEHEEWREEARAPRREEEARAARREALEQQERRQWEERRPAGAEEEEVSCAAEPPVDAGQGYAAEAPPSLSNVEDDVVPRSEERAVEAHVPEELPCERFLNTLLVDRDDATRRLTRLEAGMAFGIRMLFGPLEETETHVENPEAIPLMITGESIELDVLVSSLDFVFGPTGTCVREEARTAAHGRLVVPRDPAHESRAADGARYLSFCAWAPTNKREARARICLYYRDALVQSQVLCCNFAEPTGKNFSLRVDYTISSTLTDLDVISERPRMSVMLNDDPQSGHVLTLRSVVDEQPLAEPVRLEIPEGAKRAVELLRAALSHGAPTSRRASKQQLVSSLRQLAPPAFEMWSAVRQGNLDLLHRMGKLADSAIISIARPNASTFTLPWGLMYEICLDSELVTHSERIPLCPILSDWDAGSDDLVDWQQAPHTCPRADSVDHSENLLCPFGFWGFRYSLEQLAATARPVWRIPVSRGSAALAALEAQVNIPRGALQRHMADMDATLDAAFACALHEVRDKLHAREALEMALSLVYCYCHGVVPDGGFPDTALLVGNGEIIKAQDIQNWI